MNVVIDCDPGHDDAIALLLALASPELDLRAVTTVAGNQTLEKTTRNALKVLELAGRSDVPVAAGAARPLVRELRVAADVHGETGLDGPDLPEPRAHAVPGHAVDQIAQVLREADDPVTLIPVGPLTNVALLLSLRPELVPKIERIVLMGGAIGLGNTTPAAEFNVWVDPEAAAIVFGSGVEVTMIGLDVTHDARITTAQAEALRPAGRIGSVVADLLGFYGNHHREVYGWDGSPVHDAVAVAHAIRGDLVETRHVRVDVELSSGAASGRTLVDLRGRTGRPANAHVGVGIDGPAFAEFLLGRIVGLAQTEPAARA